MKGPAAIRQKNSNLPNGSTVSDVSTYIKPSINQVVPPTLKFLFFMLFHLTLRAHVRGLPLALVHRISGNLRRCRIAAHRPTGELWELHTLNAGSSISIAAMTIICLSSSKLNGGSPGGCLMRPEPSVGKTLKSSGPRIGNHIVVPLPLRHGRSRNHTRNRFRKLRNSSDWLGY